jgi:hypothetical protein
MIMMMHLDYSSMHKEILHLNAFNQKTEVLVDAITSQKSEKFTDIYY